MKKSSGNRWTNLNQSSAQAHISLFFKKLKFAFLHPRTCWFVGFPSKTKRSVANSRKQLSKTSNANLITDPGKSSRNFANGQEKVYPKANSSDELQKEKNDLPINYTEILKTKESKANCASIITKVSSYDSGEILDRMKKLDHGSTSDKHKPLNIPKYKDFGKPVNETTINSKLHVIPITEVFDKKYFQDFLYS
ncbi:unnamed protein product [Schistosoma margrebowiei]|uniref:Uncharacterized protein n=1 Tax=Schistosoma margrebowiei TaxID=48269 RepID=A0A183MP28_9TREM|nr:unnamed protein product [Schistosoma margrebowiei]